MPVDLHGWVEISWGDPSERNEEHAWSALINLSPLLDGTDAVSEALFGFSKRCFTGAQLGFIPVAQGRGLPGNPSQAVRDEMAGIQEHERQFGPGEFVGVSHVYLDELRQADLAARGVQNFGASDWAAVIQLIETLQASERFGGAAFRIVCWAFW